MLVRSVDLEDLTLFPVAYLHRNYAGQGRVGQGRAGSSLKKI